jgi:glycosyltransferase involved in cell wall biosynthesis
MRIVYVLTSLGMGGAEKLALALANRMEKRGHEVAVLALMPPVSEEWPTVLRKVYLNMRRSPASLVVGLVTGLVRARRFVSDFQPDLIHGHSFHANLFARLLRLLASHAVVLSTIHNVYEGGRLRMLAYRLTDGLSHRTVAVSHAAARRFIARQAVPARKCVVIPNGMDASEFAPDANRGKRMREEMQAGEEPERPRFIWLAVGRIAPAKDYPTLLHAFARVHEQRPDALLWIAGEGQQADCAALQALAAELGLCGAVCWLGLRRDMSALLDAADAFVSASAWEGMPLAVGEAMLMEKLVVATDAGGTHELVGDAGLVVPVRSPEALGEAMLDVMRQSGEERLVLGRAARARVAKKFSMDVAAEKWEALYRELVEAERRLPKNEQKGPKHNASALSASCPPTAGNRYDRL